MTGNCHYTKVTMPLQPPFIDVPKVRIPLKQHTGAPAVPVVKVADEVKAGQLIAEIPSGALGAMVHASISGTVTAITDNKGEGTMIEIEARR